MTSELSFYLRDDRRVYRSHVPVNHGILQHSTDTPILSVLIGVIGGSGLYPLDNLTFLYALQLFLQFKFLSNMTDRKHVNPETVRRSRYLCT